MSITADSRRAALTLHALSEQDREWVLRRLDAHQQCQLGEHLDELKALGIQADARLVEQALQQPAAAPPPNRRRALAACDVERLQAALQGEPAALVARLLQNGPWPWEAALLGRMATTHRARVSACRQALPASRELDEWLLAALVARLGLEAEATTTARPAITSSGAPAPGGLRRWWDGRTGSRRAAR